VTIAVALGLCLAGFVLVNLCADYVVFFAGAYLR